MIVWEVVCVGLGILSVPLFVLLATLELGADA